MSAEYDVICVREREFMLKTIISPSADQLKADKAADSCSLVLFVWHVWSHIAKKNALKINNTTKRMLYKSQKIRLPQ